MAILLTSAFIIAPLLIASNSKRGRRRICRIDTRRANDSLSIYISLGISSGMGRFLAKFSAKISSG